MLELQEANKDVLVGKRNFNCLSCGQDNVSKNIVTGKDGRCYRGNDLSLGTSIKDMTMLTHKDETPLNALSKIPSETRATSSNAPRRGKTNLRERMGSNELREGRSSGHFMVLRTKGNLSVNKSYVTPQDTVTPDAYADTRTSKQLSGAISGTNINSHTASHEAYNRRMKPKLPFGFLVQQEKKVGGQFGGKMRPDSAKVEMGLRLRSLNHEL